MSKGNNNGKGNVKGGREAISVWCNFGKGNVRRRSGEGARVRQGMGKHLGDHKS